MKVKKLNIVDFSDIHCKQAIGQKMSELIADKENKRFAANTADMTQDDHFVIAILEMCTDRSYPRGFVRLRPTN